MKNYSRQREAILQVLRSTDTHPSASAVYNEVRKLIPNISLGTVYRNLAALAEDGSVLSLSVGAGYEHFDGNASPHAHLHCKQCGKIFDAPLERDFLADTAKQNSFKSETTVYIAYGVCKACSLKSENRNNKKSEE